MAVAGSRDLLISGLAAREEERKRQELLDMQNKGFFSSVANTVSNIGQSAYDIGSGLINDIGQIAGDIGTTAYQGVTDVLGKPILSIGGNTFNVGDSLLPYKPFLFQAEVADQQLTGGKVESNLEQAYQDAQDIATDIYQGAGDILEGIREDTIDRLKPDIPNISIPAFPNNPNVTNVEGKKKKRRSSIDELRSGLASTIRTKPEGLLGSGKPLLSNPTATKGKLGE